MPDETQARDDRGIPTRLRRAVMSDRDQLLVGPSIRPSALAAYGIVVIAALLAQVAIAVYITCVARDVRSEVQIIRDMQVREQLDASRDEVRRDDQVGHEDRR